MTKEIITVPPTSGFDIVLVQGLFDAGLAELATEDVNLWSAEKLAELRRLLGPQHQVSTRWSWLAENFNYLPDSEADILIASRNCNPLLQNPAEATSTHRKNEEYFLPAEIVNALRERAQLDPDQARQSGVLRLLRSEVMAEIPIIALKDYKVTRFLFGEQAKPYGEFLQVNGITNVPFYVADKDYVQKQDKAFGRALGIISLDGGSSLNGFNYVLHLGGGRVGGVRYSNAREAGAPEVPQGINVTLVDELEARLKALVPGQTLEHDGRTYAYVDPASLKR